MSAKNDRDELLTNPLCDERSLRLIIAKMEHKKPEEISDEWVALERRSREDGARRDTLRYEHDRRVLYALVTRPDRTIDAAIELAKLREFLLDLITGRHASPRG